MGINVRQLYDDLAAFYPITCVEAVVGGTITEGSLPVEIDLSSYISENFSGEIKLYSYDNGNMIFYEVNVSTAEGYTINPLVDTIIASNIPIIYYPKYPIIFKTITDDDTCKANVVLDTDGVFKLCVIPETLVSISGSEVTKAFSINIHNIFANSISIADV